MSSVFRTQMTFEHRIAKALMAGGLLFSLMICIMGLPADLPLPGCTFRSLTGHSCMTCGMTRSLHAISHGELAAALRYHLFGPVVFIGMLLYLVICTAEAISGKQSTPGIGAKTTKRAVTIFALVWLVYWIARLFLE